jgi:hypothetical protein
VKPLTDQELQQVVEKCGFAYMQEHKNNFEMQPPHVMQTNADLFVRGTADRHKDVAPEVRKRLVPGRPSSSMGAPFRSARLIPT